MLKVAKFEFALFGINTYVVYDAEKKECAIIDPGMSSREEITALEGFIEKNGLKPVHLINTHLHVDHAIGDAYVSKRYGLGVSGNEGDSFLGRLLSGQSEAFGLNMEVENVEITTFLKEGDVVHIGGGELRVLHVPGHSPGSIVLYDEKDGFLISGDVLFQDSIGRTDLPRGDYATLIGGIKGKLLRLPDSTIVYPGHGPSTTIGKERAKNPFLR